MQLSATHGSVKNSIYKARIIKFGIQEEQAYRFSVSKVKVKLTWIILLAKKRKEDTNSTNRARIIRHHRHSCDMTNYS